QEKGFLGGEQILAINGLLVSKMDIDDFKKQMRSRPIDILIDWTAEDPSKMIATLEADETVKDLGLFLPFASPLLVAAVKPDAWAAQMRLKGGEAVLEINGVAVTKMTADQVAAALQRRPLAMLMNRAPKAKEEEGPFPRRLVTLQLRSICFIHDILAVAFDTGQTLADTTEALRQGLAMGDEEGMLPRIRVVRFHGVFFCLDGRRLRCLLDAEGPQAEVWEECFQQVKEEFLGKLAASLPLQAPGRGPKPDVPRDVCRSFTLSLFDDRDQSALEAVVRRSFEERIERLRQECDGSCAALAEVHLQLHQKDASLAAAVMQTLGKVSVLTAMDFYRFLPKPPRMKQLQEVLRQLMDAGKVLVQGSAEEQRYFRTEMPSGHPSLHIEREDGKWVIRANAPRGTPCEAFAACSLWRPPRPKPDPKATTKAKPRPPPPPPEVHVELRGWSEVMLGVWPEDTELRYLFAAPLPHQDTEVENPVAPLPAPGWWISCSSGARLGGGRRCAPLAWNPPARKEGVRWAARFEASGPAVTFACAESGRDFQWEGRRWFGEVPVPGTLERHAPALLLQLQEGAEVVLHEPSL
ncbi:unnamed protein product, partial [Effrenium voratum]